MSYDPLLSVVSKSELSDISAYIQEVQNRSLWTQYKAASVQERDLVLVGHTIARVSAWLLIYQQSNLYAKRIPGILKLVHEISSIQASFPMSGMLATMMKTELNVSDFEDAMTKDVLDQRLFAITSEIKRTMGEEYIRNLDAGNTPWHGMEDLTQLRSILSKHSPFHKLSAIQAATEVVSRHLMVSAIRFSLSCRPEDMQFLPIFVHPMLEAEIDKVVDDIVPSFLSALAELQATMMAQQTVVKGMQSKVLAGMVTAAFGLVQFLVKRAADQHD